MEERIMNRFARYLIALVVLLGCAGYVDAAVNQGFEGSGTPYMELDGSFNIENNSGNSFMKFGPDAGQMFPSTIQFSNVVFTNETSVFSFDYKFDYEFDSAAFSAFAADVLANDNIVVDFQNLDFGDSDYFGVATDTYTFFQQFINPATNTFTNVFSATDLFGFDLNPTFTPITGGELDGFTHVEFDMTEFINYLSLGAGQTYVTNLYFDIFPGFEKYYDGLNNSYAIPDEIFNYSASVDNINLGAGPAAVPEPAAYALFVFGVWFLGKRIRVRQ